MDFDVIVIGAGPGGYVAAIRCAQLGLKTACVEKRTTLGGTCLNVGCIPSKALLQSTEYYDLIAKKAEKHGIHIKEKKLDFDRMMARKEEVVKGLVDGIAVLFKKNKITRIEGVASFTATHEIEVNEKKYSAQNFIIATGSEPVELPFIPFDEEKIVSSTGALCFKKIPKTLAVIGGGVIGVELASVYNRLGSQVTVIELMDVICPGMDTIVSKTLLQVLKKQGIAFHLGAKVEKGEVTRSGVTVTYSGKEDEFDAVLVAVGRKPYTKGLNLETLAIQTDKKGFIPVDGVFRTSQPHIYAIGDIIEGPMLAHKASEEGIAVAEIIAGHLPHLSYIAIPNVVYTHPEVATVGLTEEEAKQLGLTVMTGKAFYKGNPRARCVDDTDGVVKVIGDKTSGRLVGLHIVGPHASEMVGEGVIALESKLTVDELARASHAHPTLSEAIMEASQDTLGRAIHG